MSAVEEKQQFRVRMRARRAAWPAAARHAASEAASAALLEVLTSGSSTPSMVAIYLAKGDELSLDTLADGLIRQGIAVAAPVVGEGAEPAFAEVSSLDVLTTGLRGIRVPPPGARVVTFEQLDAIVLPGLAYTRCGDRLGYGGGWYDRALARNVQRKSPVIGACYQLQVVEELPREPHDQKVAFIATENGVVSALVP